LEGVVGIARRRFLLSGSLLVVQPVLWACSTTSALKGDCTGSTELDLSLCRQKAIAASAPSYITAAMIIGGVLGAGIAVATRENPVVGAIGGALLLGGATAAERYIAYRLEQAHGDRVQMKADIRRDVDHDVNFSAATVDDQKLATAAAHQAILNNDHDLYKNANILEKAKQVAAEARKNAQTFSATYKLYVLVAAPQFTGLISEAPVRAGIATLGGNTKIIHDDGEEFVSFLAKADING
jgi:hypothetical protein